MNFAGKGPTGPSPTHDMFPDCVAVVVITVDADSAVVEVLLVLLMLLLFKLLL
jgi:hypothetical protein